VPLLSWRFSPAGNILFHRHAAYAFELTTSLSFGFPASAFSLDLGVRLAFRCDNSFRFIVQQHLLGSYSTQRRTCVTASACRAVRFSICFITSISSCSICTSSPTDSTAGSSQRQRNAAYDMSQTSAIFCMRCSGSECGQAIGTFTFTCTRFGSSSILRSAAATSTAAIRLSSNHGDFGGSDRHDGADPVTSADTMLMAQHGRQRHEQSSIAERKLRHKRHRQQQRDVATSVISATSASATSAAPTLKRHQR
jgi:hypothetical protein